MRIFAGIAASTLALLLSQGAFATPAKNVSAARAETDVLAERLKRQRRANRDELTALRRERADLLRQVRLEGVRRDTVARLRADRTKQIDQQEGRQRALLSVVQRALASAKRHVVAILPFKRKERMRRLQRIATDLAVSHPDPARGLTQLWRFVEEEQALTRSIGLSQQAIELDGKRRLVQVARVGMALMYVRLPDGGVGRAVQRQSGWRFERILGGPPRSTVLALFDDLENNRVFGPKRLLMSTPLAAADRAATAHEATSSGGRSTTAHP